MPGVIADSSPYPGPLFGMGEPPSLRLLLHHPNILGCDNVRRRLRFAARRGWFGVSDLICRRK